MITTAQNLPALAGRRVHIWQPLGLTSRKHIHATLDHLSGQEGGPPVLHLTDATEIRPGTDPVAVRNITLPWSLNWQIEEVA